MPKIRAVYDLLNNLNISYSARILSAHRTPVVMANEARNLEGNGFKVCIAAAGGSAHLPGMTASETSVPVIGLPVYSETFKGLDALYSILQMPNGIPVATVGIGQAEHAALLAAQITSLNNTGARNNIRRYRHINKKEQLNTKLNPLVGVITTPETEPDSPGLSDMMSLINSLGLNCKHLQSADDNGTFISILEQNGATAIICVGSYNHSGIVHAYNIAGKTDIPVIGLPVKVKGHNAESDINKLLFNGNTPVAVMGVNRYVNAALYAAQIAGLYFNDVRNKFTQYRAHQAEKVRKKDELLVAKGMASLQ